MFNPNLVLHNLEEFLDSMTSERFFRFFHVPLQSGSNRVLKLMNRKYSVEDWKDVVSRILSRFPGATIATDIIVGFPGESDDDFAETLALMREVKPGVINVSKYGDRPGTQSSKARNKVNTDVKKERSRQLSLLVTEVITERNEQWLSWQGPVIITNPATKGGLQGRTSSYKPVILSDMVSIGDIVEVKILSAHRTHLSGSIV
jgi:tRNA A37 methylthiotransferase MiaB